MGLLARWAQFRARSVASRRMGAMLNTMTDTMLATEVAVKLWIVLRG